MGYPMTYPRVIHRNGLLGDYVQGLIAGDLRRLEKDQRDEHHLSRYATYADVTPEQADKVLEAFFTDFGARLRGSITCRPAKGIRRVADETRSAASGRDTGHWVEEYECAHCRREVIVALFAAWPEKCPHCGVWGATLRTKGAQRADAADGHGTTPPGSTP